MKVRIAALLALTLIAYAMSACTTTTTTTPTGATVITKTTDPAAIQLGSAVVVAALDEYAKAHPAKQPAIAPVAAKVTPAK